MKNYLRFLVFGLILFLLIFSALPIKAQRAVNKSTTVGNTTDYYYGQKYTVRPGFATWFDENNRGYMFRINMEYYYQLNNARKLGSGWVFGAFAEGSAGGLWAKDGSYNEPGSHWEAGGKVILKEPGLYYGLSIGYGQNFLSSQLSTGFKQKLFSDYIFGELEFHPYSNRQLVRNSIWFNDARLILGSRFCLREDKFFWPKKPINFDLLPQKIYLSGELSIIDWQFSKKFMMPIGIMAGYSQFDLDNSKYYSEVGCFFDGFYNQRNVARIFFCFQSGISGAHFSRYNFGLSIDFGTFLNENEPKISNVNNSRRK
jgi:hypothetical protein